MRRFVVFVAPFLMTLGAVGQVSAAPQSKSKGSATITGVVLGPDDRPVPRASVSYQLSSGSAPHVVRADSHGAFTIPKLKADVYDVRASGKGVFSDWAKNITLRSGQTKSVTLQLIYAREIPKAYVKRTPKQTQQ